MIEDIRFSDSNKKINITIDNEKQDISIKKIDKLQTYIDLKQSLNTPLKENIILDAFLCYLPYDTPVEEIEDMGDTSFTLDVTPNTYVVQNHNNIEITATFHSDSEEKNFKGRSVNFYSIDEEETNLEFSTARIVDGNGVVTVIIYNQNNDIYYQNNITFTNGVLYDIIPNTLPIGEYKATIIFEGNKYLQPTTLNIDFNIEKRLAFFTFDKEEYFGDPNENIVISGLLKDVLTKKVIKECPIKFDFDSNTYTTITNILGNASFYVTIPDTNIMHCLSQPNNEYVEESISEIGEEYEDDPEEHLDFDDDGNIIEIVDEDIIDAPFVEDDYQNTYGEDSSIFYTNINDNSIDDEWDYGYPNASYALVVYLDSDSYYVKDTVVNIVANKIPTSTIINQTSDVENNIVTLGGKIIAHYKNEDKNVKYGNIVISFDDTDYISNKIDINRYGEFNTQIDFDEVNLTINKSDITTLTPYKKNLSQDTTINITSDSQVSVGEPITAIATTYPTNSNTTVKDGMVVFILTANNKEIYRYGSQIDDVGRAVFFFNTSKKATYQIQAHYYGLFGYNKSDSNIETIEVI